MERTGIMGSGVGFSEKAIATLSQALGEPVPTAVIGCMDPRCCVKQRHPLREQLAVKSYFSFTHAGGGFPLAQQFFSKQLTPYGERRQISDATRIVVAHGLKIAIENRGLKRVIISTHPDCAHVRWEGYIFGDREAEKNLHREKRTSACRWLLQKFPELDVWHCMLRFDERCEVQIDEVSQLTAEEACA